MLSFDLGFALGKMSAWRRGGWFEYTSAIGGVVLYTVFTPMVWPDDDLAVRIDGGLLIQSYGGTRP